MASPSIVPLSSHTVYLVLEDLGAIGLAYAETDPVAADMETVLTAMLTGQFTNPIAVIAFNIDEGWARDVSEAMAHQIRLRASVQGLELRRPALTFIDRHPAADGQRLLPFRPRVAS